MSKLDTQKQEKVVQALIREYGWLGISVKVARKEVAEGKWDDHPSAK